MGKRRCPKCKSEDLWVDPLKCKVDNTIYTSISCGTCGHKVFGASAEKTWMAVTLAWMAWEEDVSVSHVEEFGDLTRDRVVNAIRGYFYGKTKKKA